MRGGLPLRPPGNDLFAEDDAYARRLEIEIADEAKKYGGTCLRAITRLFKFSIQVSIAGWLSLLSRVASLAKIHSVRDKCTHTRFFPRMSRHKDEHVLKEPQCGSVQSQCESHRKPAAAGDRPTSAYGLA